MPWLFLGVAATGFFLTVNAYWPLRRPAILAGVSFFAGWLTTELAFHHFAWQVGTGVVLVAMGALRGWPGWVALGLTVASWPLLYACFRQAAKAEDVVDRALADALGEGYEARIPPGLSARLAPRVDWRSLVVPIPFLRPEVERIRDIVYTEGPGYRMKLDVYRRRGARGPLPTILQIHGGAWIIGNKNQQGLPLIMHLAARGWLCISVNYRLAPRATFPAPLFDLKQALRFVREHGRDYGADPEFVVVTGGSAGGHLASLLALTANDPEYQPGFERVDTSVQGCVAFYGVYDFTDRKGFWPHKGLARLLELAVMKTPLLEAREAYEKASPLSLVNAHAPPFFVIHGDSDSLVPVREARHFAEALREVTRSPVAYAEIPGAQHAFEVFPSLRTSFVVHGVERFLAVLYAEHVKKKTRVTVAPRLEEDVGAEREG